MQQFGASMFHMLVHWHKLSEVESGCTLHNFINLAIFMPNIIKFSENLTQLWQKQFWLFFDIVCMWVTAQAGFIKKWMGGSADVMSGFGLLLG